MVFRITWLFVLALSFFSASSQSKDAKVYFDKWGKSCGPEVAYYYRVADTGSYYKSYYVQNDKLYFEGRMLYAADDDDSRNVYNGKCVWYYKGGGLKFQRNFNNKGYETGTSKHYYESGKIWKEIEYENGKIQNNTYTEYNEDGARNRILEDEFVNNFNEWDLYTSDKSASNITGGQFEILSTSKEGTARYINHYVESQEYTVEAIINIADIKENDKVGIIYGFKDWQNYHYFAISKKHIFIGSFYEGVKSIDIDGMFCSSINPNQDNTIKVLCTGDKDYFSVNGEIQYKNNNNRLFGNNFGYVLSGNTKLRSEKFSIKQMNISKSGSPSASATDRDVKVTGSGIIFGANGYILTNYHVVEHANRFTIEVGDNSGRVSYNADVVIHDKENDLAILKIKDDKFTGIPLKYAFKENGLIDVGGSVFTIGYPHALSGMGKEAKFTDGKISSKTGYNGSINSFQTTIPVQPGNSGGPVFNDSGQLIGVINATFKEADNVSYAIKLNYIKNLIELLPERVELPNNSTISELSLEEKLKVLTNYVVLVKGK